MSDNYVEQSSQNDAPSSPDLAGMSGFSDGPSAPDVTPSAQPDPSVLSNVVQQQSSAPPSFEPPTQGGGIGSNGTDDGSQAPPRSGPPPTGSRLGAILAAIAGVVGPGIAGASNQRGRGSFAGGLSGGAQAELEYKFKTAADAARTAQLTMQDKELHLRTQEAQDQHDEHVMGMVKSLQEAGQDFDIVPNDAAAVKQYMKGQSLGDGITAPPGTMITTKFLYIPKSSDASAQAQSDLYDKNAAAYFMPSRNGKPLNPTLQQGLLNRMQGLQQDGKAFPKDQLPQQISIMQQQRDALAKQPGTLPATLANLDNTIGNMKAQLKSSNDNETQQKQADKQAELDVANSPANQQAAARGAALKKTAETNAENTANQKSLGRSTAVTVDPNTHADESFLKSLPPSRSSLIRQIGEGRQELTPTMMRSKDGQLLSQQVARAYPDFDASRAQSYFKTRQDFTSGKTSVGINSYNTAIAHLGTMYDHVSATNSLQINNPASTVHRQLELDKQLVSTELAKAVSNGQMTEGEKKDILDSISGYTVGSYQDRIKEAVDLLNGKLEAYQTQWNNGAPPGAVSQVRILSQKSEATLQHIKGGGQQQQVPQRPASVPPNAIWNPGTKTWQLPK